MTNTNSKSLRALHDLIATCNDAAEGYGKAAKGVHATELSDFLAAMAGERNEFAADLSKVVTELGGESRVDLHEGGILHKGWVDLDQSLRPKDDPEILKECIDGDKGTLKHYDHALSLDFPSDVRTALLAQKIAVEHDLDSLQSKIDRGLRADSATR